LGKYWGNAPHRGNYAEGEANERSTFERK
jgi:hypothetical protein